MQKNVVFRLLLLLIFVFSVKNSALKENTKDEKIKIFITLLDLYY